MSLDLDIRALLLTPQVREINFSMGTIRVTGHGFTTLATCFSDGPTSHRVRVTVRPELVSAGSDAQYMSGPNRINLRAPTVLETRIGRSYVVHECTHAQLDMRRRDTRSRNEEGAAFIAEAWYLLACGETESVIDRSISEDIRLIASSLRTQSTASSGIVEVSSDQTVSACRYASRTYRDIPYVNDGIGSLRYHEPVEE